MKTSLKSICLIICIIVVNACVAMVAQQEYKSHVVQKGETVYSLSKKYGIPEQMIYKLNPDAKKGIRENAIIILPLQTGTLVTISNDPTGALTFKKHKVKRKETLFSISQEYGVTIDDIKKYNKFLYAETLRKGDKLQIPIAGASNPVGDIIIGNKPNLEDTTTAGIQVIDVGVSAVEDKHTVQPKETLFGIARMYGITLEQLKSINPDVNENNLPIGTILNVPSIKIVETATLDEYFIFYEVKPKEGFYRVGKNFNTTEEEIIALNPYAKDGLKEGMIIKLPKPENGIELSEISNKINLENYIANTDEKRIAVLLPFQLNKATTDSTDTQKDMLKGNPAMRVALDFYSGVLMATQFAKDKGISTRLDVYDTQGKETTVSNLITNNNIAEVDAVIGPLLSKTVARAASELKRSNTPVFSPLSNREVKMSSNLFQTIPESKYLKEKMLEYLEANAAEKNMVIIADAKHGDTKAGLLAKFPLAKTVAPREEGYVYQIDVQTELSSDQENWVVLSSEDPVFVSNVIALLNGMPVTKKIRLFTLDKNSAFDYEDVQNLHLANLGFTFPSVSKSYNYKERNAFLISYKNTYGVLPNRFAVRGFDVTYDVLLRLASDEDVYKASKDDYETEYIENKFRYTKELLSGYKNIATYILKYTDKLQFEIVE